LKNILNAEGAVYPLQKDESAIGLLLKYATILNPNHDTFNAAVTTNNWNNTR
jgi:hypothetical protein